MYDRDVADIIKHVQSNGPDGLVDVGTFVLCTIQTPLSRTGQQVAEVRQRGVEAAALWGSKRAGYGYLLTHKEALYERLVERPHGETVDTVRYIMQVPGLGVPKASFLAQCLGYDVGCLDSHNLKRFNKPINFVKATANSRKVRDYVEFTQSLGTEELWNGWCEYVAGNRVNKFLPTADEVSRYHVHAITGVA